MLGAPNGQYGAAVRADRNGRRDRLVRKGVPDPRNGLPDLMTGREVPELNAFPTRRQDRRSVRADGDGVNLTLGAADLPARSESRWSVPPSAPAVGPAGDDDL